MKQIQLQESTIKTYNPLEEGIRHCKSAFTVTFMFAFVVNILMLITPLYSLQVLDRVIGSGNLSTLLMLSLIIGFIYFVYTLVQIARSFTLIKIGEWLDNKLSPLLFSHSVAAAALRPSLGAGQALRDFQVVKGFLTSVGINTIFDAPWSIAYIAVIFMIHPYIGYLTVLGGVVIVCFAFVNAAATNKILGEANEYSIKSLTQAEIATRNAEVVEAMGMMNNVSNNWFKFNKAALDKQSIASYRNGILSNISRFIRNVMQMAVTGIGAYVVVKTGGRDMTTGGMIASSIMVGRALAPFDNAIEVWKSINSAMKSYKRLTESFKHSSLRDDAMPLPKIKGNVAVDNIYYAAPTAEPLKPGAQPRYILKGVSFSAEPGEILAVIGPSASGKSTLAKILVGVWKCVSGAVRLDGGEIYRWNRDDFGQHIGYVPQGIELFSGSIKQNIARMSDNPDPEKVVEAARMAGAHDMILCFPEGYDSDIGVAGSNLSGGQRQRVALARAFYGDPKLLILDEPNANLDEAGENALALALVNAREKGMSVIVISHRPSILSVVDKILILQEGSVLAFGPKADVLARLANVTSSGNIHVNTDDEMKKK
jgi:PrtD family type I secretion system ABC transporter